MGSSFKNAYGKQIIARCEEYPSDHSVSLQLGTYDASIRVVLVKHGGFYSSVFHQRPLEQSTGVVIAVRMRRFSEVMGQFPSHKVAKSVWVLQIPYNLVSVLLLNGLKRLHRTQRQMLLLNA